MTWLVSIYKTIMFQKLNNFTKNLLGIDYKSQNVISGFDQGLVVEVFAKILNPSVYVELGLYKCDVFNRVSKFAGKSYGIDIDKSSGEYMRKDKNNYFYCGSTRDFLADFKSKGLGIDMIFIDADHSKDAVIADFKECFPLVKENGLIFLHDSYPGSEEYIQQGYCGDCYEAIVELSKNIVDYEMMTIPKHPGLTICRKRVKHLSWL